MSEGVITIVFSHYLPDGAASKGSEGEEHVALVNCSMEGRIQVAAIEHEQPWELDVEQIRRLKGIAIAIDGQRWSWDLDEETGEVELQWSKTTPPVIGGDVHVPSV